MDVSLDALLHRPAPLAAKKTDCFFFVLTKRPVASEQTELQSSAFTNCHCTKTETGHILNPDHQLSEDTNHRKASAVLRNRLNNFRRAEWAFDLMSSAIAVR